MLSSVLAAITCIAIPVSDPLEISAQMKPDQAPVEVGTYVTATSFRSRNFSNVNQLLVFGAAGVPTPVLVTLPPGGIVQYDFAPQALDGVMLEVVSLRGGVMTTSGEHVLALPAGSVDQSLWTVPAASGLVTWQQLGCEVTLLPPQGSFLPAGLASTGSGTEAATAPPMPPIAVPRSTLSPWVQSKITPM
jgi:hypothetical protein